jgi:dTDP-4-dehydrorhamnose reductase
MRILIFGGTGMLGHRLWMNLAPFHETWVTVHGGASELPDITAFSRKYILPHVDALRLDQVVRAVSSVRPDWIINCIGLIKQRVESLDPFASISVNALFPHQLSLVCQTARARVIHLSTDCVFSGGTGQYTEESVSDAEDLYGRTKFLGEVASPHAVTVRTSMIGRELKTRYGLVEWFVSQKSTVKGYRKALFSGFTTDELSRILLHYVLPRPELSGLYHVSSEPISKYDLLLLLKESFGIPIDILPDEELSVDRSLDSTRFKEVTGYQPPTWEAMVDELKENSRFYDKLRG